MVVVLAVVSAIVWWVIGDGPDGGGSAGMGDAPPGVSAIGAAPSGAPPTVGPGAGGTGTGESGVGGGDPGGPLPTAGAATASGGAGAPGATAKLVASYEITERLLADTVIVTISNVGQGEASWSMVVLVLSGVNLVVTVDGEVDHEARGNQHIFTARPGTRTVAGGGSVEFAVRATGGVLGSVDSCTLDGQSCTG
jgi:hypothetical protein